jgi:tetratricopeptide (TPR) repeat protein
VAFLPVTFGVVAPLGVLGVWFARRRLGAQFPLWGFALIYAATVVAFFVTSRFRLPVVPVLIIYAGFAVQELGHLLRRRDWPALGGSAAALTALWLLTHTHMPEGYFAEAPSYCAIGEAFHRAGQDEAALAEYEKALQVSPEYAKAHVASGMIYWDSKRWPEAVTAFQEALRLDPRSAVYAHLAEALSGVGRHSEAISTLRKGIEVHRQDPSLYRGLAWLLATSPNAADRNGAEALKIAERIVQAFADDPLAHDTLAAALAESGRFVEARQHAEKALELAEKSSDQQMVIEIRQRLHQYENRQPHRQK